MHAFTCNIFSISYYVAAQDVTAMSYDYNARVDSLANAYKQQETAKEQVERLREPLRPKIRE